MRQASNEITNDDIYEGWGMGDEDLVAGSRQVYLVGVINNEHTHPWDRMVWDEIGGLGLVITLRDGITGGRRERLGWEGAWEHGMRWSGEWWKGIHG